MKEIEIAVTLGKELDPEMVKAAAAKALGVKPAMVGEWKILRRSIDARKEPLWRYRVEVCKTGEKCSEAYSVAPYQDVHNAREVIVVGSGPAGMFAALHLLQKGLKPVILERGKDVHARKRDIAALNTGALLNPDGTPHVNPDSNYCFGEGGAGTFSDGKLFTRSSKRGDIREVLHQLVQFGADPEILIDAHPHIGSDRLAAIVENIRLCILEHGGEYHFDTKVNDIEKTAEGIKVSCASGDVFTASDLILATGHSARDIYELFERKGWALEAKGFALGVRAEHPQSLINQIQYSGRYQPYMPTAEYSFVTQIEGRGVFSFCMCPGGVLVPSMTEDGTVVLNGMSNSGRTGKTANSGVVVSIEPEDFPEYMAKHGSLGLMRFQQEVERAMYRFTGSFKAPGQRMMDFCRRIESKDLPKSTYHPGVVPAPLHELLPEHVSLRLKYAFPQIGNKLIHKYYTNDALLLGVESRTSSPVRIPRDPETLQYISVPGLYPCGEGAGYSGGIVSSALDGIRCADAVCQKQ